MPTPPPKCPAPTIRSPLHRPPKCLAPLLAPLLVLGACLLVALWASPLAADLGPDPDEVSLSYYLPPGGEYDPAIPEPAQVFGHEVGQRHLRPDQIVAYGERLAAASDRVRLEVMGRTHEFRPQILLTISSPENLAHLEEIRRRHRALSEPGGEDLDPTDQPAVVYMGYSIHGNEPSGANASVLVAYHLAAGLGQEVEEILDRTVILLDPMLNPDGLDRFAHWVNTRRGARVVTDPASAELDEPWPGGRTNHYWFDLNRDWLLLQHPESRHRVEIFQRWRPNVLTDFHEMGSNATYFFQPGVPSRKNPLTPEANVRLTEAIAEYHADALDAIGSLYYTEETFDDFYYGKGSTYPDIQGAVGILFEQASSRGHRRETANGLLSFPFTIRNQFTTSLSTLRAVRDLRQDLLTYQRDFYAEARRTSAGSGGWLIGDAQDPQRLTGLVEILQQHGIEVRTLGETVETESTQGRDTTFRAGEAVFVPRDQRQTRLAEAIFSTPTTFVDDTFYDVSAWTLPYAFGLPFAILETSPSTTPGAPPTGVPGTSGSDTSGSASSSPVPDSVAWAFEWHHHRAPRALQSLLERGARVRAATAPVTVSTPDGPRELGRGSIFIPAGAQGERLGSIRRALGRIAAEDGIELIPIVSGLTPAGGDLGGPSLPLVPAVRPALLIGDGVFSYEAGELWHLLDERWGIPLTLLPTGSLEGVDLSRYTHLLLVSGFYRFSEEVQEDLRRWVRDGGVLVASSRGASWVERSILELSSEAIEEAFADRQAREEGAPEGGEEAAQTPRDRLPYDEHSRRAAQRLVSGTIFEAELDLTHPLAFGYTREHLPVFRTSSGRLTPTSDPYAAPFRYSEDPLLAGYVSPENLENLEGIQAVIATRLGRGVVIRMVDNPTFRGIWWGTHRLVANALFFGPLIESTDLPPGVRPDLP